MDEETKAAFAKMGFSLEELTKDVDKLNEHADKRRSRKVCICGHTHTKHKRNSLGDMRCRPNARYCHCDSFRGVIETSNLRVFMRFSRGNDTLHALSQGIHALMQEGGSFKWIDGACICQKCGATDEIIPVVITTDASGENAKLYVFPSINEGFGIPVLEAFKHNVPVVIANNTCLPEVAGLGAKSFNPYDITEIAQTITLLLNDQTMRQSYIEKGKEQLQKFSWEKTADSLMQLFKKAVVDSVSYNDFEKRVYGILGPKYFKLAKIEKPGAMKDYYDSVRVTRPSMEEAFDLDIDDAHGGEGELDNAVVRMGYNESLKKSLKESLNKRLGK